MDAHKPAGPTLATNGKHAPAPQLTRLTDSIELVAPPGCSASVVLKLVKRDDGHRYYAFWLVAGRHDLEAATVAYKHTGEDAIRCDLPQGMPLSAAALQPHLATYLDSLSEKGGDPPVITH
ncbi:MAG TPA: hypothetical protein VHW23_08295 [Kofleriaceae bacterium]|nr:hypothetical protein [Kofleriaceae bacterium]